MRADKEQDPQLRFQLINPVADGARCERQLVGGQGKRLVPRRYFKGRQPGELPAVQQPGTYFFSTSITRSWLIQWLLMIKKSRRFCR